MKAKSSLGRRQQALQAYLLLLREEDAGIRHAEAKDLAARQGMGHPGNAHLPPQEEKMRKVRNQSRGHAMGKRKEPALSPLTIVRATFARILAFEEVARIFSVHWNTVRAAVKSAVDYGLAHRDTTSVIAIGTDEISRRKGHKYMTMV